MNYKMIRITEIKPGDIVYQYQIDQVVLATGTHNGRTELVYGNQSTHVFNRSDDSYLPVACEHRRRYEKGH